MATNSIPTLFKLRVGFPWLSAVVVFTIAAALTFTLHFPEHAFLKGLRQLGPGSMTGPRIDLRVEQQGDRILLRWNRDNPALRSFTNGILRIDDGSQHRDIQLDSALLATGAVLYRPESDDISFHLELRGQHGQIVSESMRMLDGASRPVPTPAVAPVTTATIFTNSEPASHRQKLTKATLAERDFQAAAFVPPSVAKPLERSTAGAVQPEHLASARSTQPRSEPSAPAPTGTQLPPASAHSTPVTTAPLNNPAPDSEPRSLGAAPETTHQLNDAKTSNQANDVPDRVERPKQLVPSVASQQSPLTEIGMQKPSAVAIVPCKPLRQVMPDVRKFGLVTAIPRSLELQVGLRVDARGTVTEAHLVGDHRGIPSSIAFAALDAARQWTFRPATLRGQNIASDHTLVFKFGSSGH